MVAPEGRGRASRELEKRGTAFVGSRFDNVAGIQYGWARVTWAGKIETSPSPCWITAGRIPEKDQARPDKLHCFGGSAEAELAWHSCPRRGWSRVVARARRHSAQRTIRLAPANDDADLISAVCQAARTLKLPSAIAAVRAGTFALRRFP